MLHFSRWQVLGTLLVSILLCAALIPNILPQHTYEALPSFLQRKMSLGLDLQGGSHILLEVDAKAVREDRLNTLRDDVRRVLRDARIGYTGLTTQGMTVQLRLREAAGMPDALAQLRELSNLIGGVFGTSAARDVEVADAGDNLIRLTLTDAGLNDRIRQAVTQSIEIVRRRVDELGTVEPLIQRQGANRVLVQVPGLQDPGRLKQLLGKTAQLTFRFVDSTMSAQQAIETRPPPESEVLMSSDRPPIPYLIERRVMVSGEDLVDAQPGFDQRSNEPIVTFRFNNSGARRFAQATQQNVGRPFAIVLDNEVISAPVIREPILGGSGQISGNFTVQQANDLAILLRAGALPAPLNIVEERTVGPGLGRDSIEAGKVAAYVGTALVVVFMLATYGLYGVFANIAVFVNVGMIFGILSLLGATLTLPGIAGIVLTVGMAVDSNVVIYERIREEFRTGRSAITAIDAGFKEALRTIVDANVTSLIAGLILFYIGTGPVRGFALTLSIGIITTMFTAYTLTRLMIATWVRWTRPSSIPI
jgi:preprotein translocase subunit SecD